MIIQPFVENAIWHGLRNVKFRNRVLEISFILRGSILICKVDDNGIGVKKAIENRNASDNKKEKSLGIDITKSRINTLSRLARKKYSITIIDKSTNSSDSGTIVTISFPVK